MYELADQHQMGQLFWNRLRGADPDSPEFEKWILEEMGRLLSPEFAQSVAAQAAASGKSMRDTLLNLPSTKTAYEYEKFLAARTGPKH